MDCENCRTHKRTGRRYCAGCGVELRQEPGDADLAESRREACPNCGTANAPGVAFCAACGVEFSAVPVAPSGSGSIPTRGLGALLDEALRVYRANFWQFVAIAAVPAAANVLANVLFATEQPPLAVLGAIFVLAYIVLSIIAVGAIVFGVARHYVRGEVDVVECYSHAFQVGVLLIAQGIVVTVALAQHSSQAS